VSLKDSKKLHLSRCFSFTLIIFLSVFSSAYSQDLSITKRGGICFRTDDNQLISRYLEYASIFDEYDQKFTLAINFGIGNEVTPEYVEGLQQIQANRHEIMDHTPIHNTSYFTTILPTDYYINHSGVQEINGNKIELQFEPVDESDAKRTGYVNINGDIITSTSGIFSSFSQSDCYLYFPSLGELVFIDEIYGWIDQNTVRVFDVWRNEIDLGIHSNIQFYNFDIYSVHLTVDGMKALAEETLRLADYYNIQRPETWIQPGSYSPRLYRNEVKQACEDGGLGYKSAGIFADPSIKVFNEYNPDHDKQFGMDWGDFRDDNWTLQQCKQIIADRVARHYVSIGESHFTYSIGGLEGGWSGFLDRTEKLIQWCIANNIPIRTYTEWANILYNQTPDSNENIFPPLNVDLDSNSVPDGYTWGTNGIWEKTDGVPTINDYCYSINTTGNICLIKELGGIEKGTNEFEIWTKGAIGDSIEVDFKVGDENFIYKFPAVSSEWTKYNLLQSINGNTILDIPYDISVIDITIRCSNYSSGEVKVSGMKLAKFLTTSIHLSSRIFLEGPYDSTSGQMNTLLNDSIPTTSPYAQDPRSVSGIPDNIVDWVLVELRATDSSSAIISKSVFIDRDGYIVSDDGSTKNVLLGVVPGSYYVVIKHRNHLAVMSANAVITIKDTLTYDFTLGSDQFYGGSDGAKEIKNGIWGMITGDGGGNGQIQNSDSEETWKQENGISGYRNGDYNMNGQVQNDDNEKYWKNNNGRGSRVPDY